jgi:hypothetical protein
MIEMKTKGLGMPRQHVRADPSPDESTASLMTVDEGTAVRSHDPGKFPADLLPEMGAGRSNLVEVKSAGVIILVQACGDIKTATLDHGQLGGDPG